MASPVTVITGREPLVRLAERLAAEPLVAFDLEADSLHHYREKVCLIQITTPRETVLVDPLAVTELSPLAPVMAARDTRKVMHGADYDIRSLFRDFAIEVNNLFDTMIACQFLGEREVGLAAVLKKRFGVELDKRYQKADWSKRPLTEGMMAYAVQDTSLLIDLYRQLAAELQSGGRLSWVEEESELVSRVRAVSRDHEPLFLRFKGAARMEPRTLAVLIGGPALYLLANALFKRMVYGRLPLSHLVGLALLAVLAPFGFRTDLLMVGGLTTLILAVVAIWESMSRGRIAQSAARHGQQA